MSFVRAIANKKMLIILFMGFYSGLPLALTGSTFKLWMTQEGINLKTIGFMSWVAMSYSLKFLWAPLLDHFSPFKMGRRKSWLLITQLLLSGSIYFLGSLTPSANLEVMIATAILIAFFSASQDIAVDAYRREYLTNEELGLGSSFTQYGYRIAMAFSGGFALYLIDPHTFGFSWQELYSLMAVVMASGMTLSFFIAEPSSSAAKMNGFYDVIIEPFIEFLKRPGALLILLFIFLYKLGDAIGASMLTPYYIKMGYQPAEIGLIAKTFGYISSMVGLFLGGLLIYYINLYKALLITGIMQALSTAAFAYLTIANGSKLALGFTVIFEDVATAMASAAFIAYISQMTNKKYTATQYAALSSVASLGRNFFSGFSGSMIETLNWSNFYFVCAGLAIPGLILIPYIKKHSENFNKA